jgi:hypothetical protein
MSSILDQIRASKLPSNMMQFAARGALQVPAADNIAILVYLAKHNKVFGETARMTLAGWDEKSCRTAAADPHTSAEVLAYFIDPDNVRPGVLPSLLENPSVSEAQLAKLATAALRETLEIVLKSKRVRSLSSVVQAVRSNPYLKKEEAEELQKQSRHGLAIVAASDEVPHDTHAEQQVSSVDAEHNSEVPGDSGNDEAVSAYLKDHAHDIAAEGNKAFQAIGGVFDYGSEHSDAPHSDPEHSDPEHSDPQHADPVVAAQPAAASAAAAAKPAIAKKPPAGPKRENALQKINSLDVKGRIQLALKGNKEERSLLIRDGTKVVALAVLEAPKLSDGEVEKFASQKNVLEAVLRQIPLKRRFMKNYIVVRNLVANPRTPLDLGLGLMKNLLAADLKNISANKEVSETIRKLALKMYKQKLDAANKK